MRLVLAPEPVDWLSQIEGTPLAPWALDFRGPGSFFRRRYLPGLQNRQSGWTLLEAAVRLWAGKSTSRGMRARFALRALASRWARERISEQGEVVAPSLAALELFATHPGRKVLMMDLPLLRQLHADLDRAATMAPHPFLHRFRATREILVRQEQELALADEIWVRGRFLAELLRARGLKCEPLPDSPPTPAPQARSRGTGILMAGTPVAARHGTQLMLRVLQAHPRWTLHLRGKPESPGVACELRAHPQVRWTDGWEQIGVVAAPSWVECYPPEVAEGFARGLPVIATSRAAGFTPVREVPPGDALALELALMECLSGPSSR